MRVEEIMSSPVTVTNRNNKIGHLKDLISRKNINAVPVSNIVTIEGMNKWQSGIYYFIFSNKDGERISKKVMKH